MLAMDNRTVALVQQSFEKVAALGLKTSQMFYAELFAIDPSSRSMLSGDMKEQHKKLLPALAYVVRSLHAPEKVLNSVERLARMHVDCGVRLEHYTYVVNALLRTLKKGLSGEFTPEVCDAWTAVFRAVALLMNEATYGRSPSMVMEEA